MHTAKRHQSSTIQKEEIKNSSKQKYGRTDAVPAQDVRSSVRYGCGDFRNPLLKGRMATHANGIKVRNRPGKPVS